MGRTCRAVYEQDATCFTGHDEEDEFGLVNMKGRLLDPKLGRFTTTDPLIANVFNGQSFAAYAYVQNNPLTFVDPCGFDRERPPILPIMERVTKEPDGSITVDLLYPPREGQAQKPLPTPNEASTVGASAPPVDTNTTGSGGEERHGHALERRGQMRTKAGRVL